MNDDMKIWIIGAAQFIVGAIAGVVTALVILWIILGGR